MGYYEYAFLKGKYRLLIKYFSPDTPKRIEETNKIVELIEAQAKVFGRYPPNYTYD